MNTIHLKTKSKEDIFIHRTNGAIRVQQESHMTIKSLARFPMLIHLAEQILQNGAREVEESAADKAGHRALYKSMVQKVGQKRRERTSNGH
jgi:hypothetical protein